MGFPNAVVLGKAHASCAGVLSMHPRNSPVKYDGSSVIHHGKPESIKAPLAKEEARLRETWHEGCWAIEVGTSMQSSSSQSRPRRSKGIVGFSRRQGPATGFAAVGVSFYAWDDDEGALISWARELARAERGELVRTPAPKRGKEGPCHSARIASGVGSGLRMQT